MESKKTETLLIGLLSALRDPVSHPETWDQVTRLAEQYTNRSGVNRDDYDQIRNTTVGELICNAIEGRE